MPIIEYSKMCDESILNCALKSFRGAIIPKKTDSDMRKHEISLLRIKLAQKQLDDMRVGLDKGKKYRDIDIHGMYEDMKKCSQMLFIIGRNEQL